MTELLTAAQMRALEQAAISSGEVTGLELMERAGQGVVAAVLEEWPELALTSHWAVVLCGPGNNGGDGFVVARLLKARGWAVEVFLYGDAGKLPPDARVNYERWAELGAVSNSDAFDPFEWGDADLKCDALFGTGLVRPLLGEAARLANAMAGGGRSVAVDAPSGLCLDSGRLLLDPVEAGPEVNITVTFHARKVGHMLEEGPIRCGTLRLADIGLDRRSALVSIGAISTARRLRDPAAVVGLTDSERHEAATYASQGTPRLAKQLGGHKYRHGHALILSGPATHTGAARLAARGALRIGAGLVSIAAPSAALPEHAARLDAIMLRRLDSADDLAALLTDPRINALCLGPGLGLDARAAGFLATALGHAPPVPGLTRDPDGPGTTSTPALGQRGPGSEAGAGSVMPDALAASSPVPGLTRDLAGQGELPADRGPGSGAGAGRNPVPGLTRNPDGQGETPADQSRAEGATARPLVLDADALTLLSRDPALFAALHQNCILTPHAGEFARLFPDLAEKLAALATSGPAYSKVDATREAAARAGCVVLYKGPDTVIADPEGRCAINSAAYDRAAPWLATAGSGDVLAGMICGLLARGFAPMQAAETAAWLHVEAARSFGPGLIAEDLPEELPKVFRALGL